MTSDAQGIAKASRRLRRRLGLRQVDMVRPGRSREMVMRIEGEEADTLRLRDIASHFAELGARVKVSVWWNGAAMDRLMDEHHAQLVERALSVLSVAGWRTESEVTFSKWGERGSIDVFAGHEPTRSVFVGEVKSEWGSIEETNRRLDVKVRLAPDIVEDRFGWRPKAIARVLILPDNMTSRRIAMRHATTVDSAYPARGREVRAWIRRPSGRLRGLWFLSEVPRRRPGSS